MSSLSQVTQNISFFQRLWKYKATVRAMLASPNFVFVGGYHLPGHFYSPIPDLGEIEANARAIFDRSPRHVAGIDLHEQEQLQLIKAFGKTYPEMPFQERHTPGARYYLDNPFFSFGDGVILYSFLRHFKPRRVIEVGSGFSSALMLDTNERFSETPIEFLFIEPRPERLYALLSDSDRRLHSIQTTSVLDVDLGTFDALEANDVLFIDTSHVGKIHSDVLHIVFNVLPRLKKGVIVHFHDVPWPFEYPENWVREGRAYNEAYLLRAFLQYNDTFEILFFNSFVALHHAELIKRTMPYVMQAPSSNETEGNSSVWLRKSS